MTLAAFSDQEISIGEHRFVVLATHKLSKEDKKTTVVTLVYLNTTGELIDENDRLFTEALILDSWPDDTIVILWWIPHQLKLRKSTKKRGKKR